MKDVIALSIPILFVVGLFTAISLNYYFKYKTTTRMSERISPESMSEWFKAEAAARAARSRGWAFRWGGFLTGIGLGILVAYMIVFNDATLSSELTNQIGDVSIDYSTAAMGRRTLITFLFIAIPTAFGGAGMIGTYFLERRLEKKSK